MSKTIKEFLLEHCEKNGFDGLYNPGECACLVDDLAPCDEPLNCHFGVKTEPPEDADQDCDYWIGEKESGR